MRKRMVLWMLTLCLLLTGCSGAVEQTEPEGQDTVAPVLGDDAQNEYMLVNALSFQETENIFCGSSLIGNYMHYYDKTSGISGVLCADPACTHDSADCGAYIQAGATLFCWGEELYFITEDNQSDSEDLYLWRSDLSGASREKVKRLGFEDVIVEYNPQQYVIHRERLYILGKKDVVDGIDTYERLTLVSTPLDSSEEFTVIFDETFDRNVHPTIRFVGDDVYLAMQIFSTSGPFDVAIMKYDTKSGETETVYEETGMAESIGQIWVTEQGEIYLPGAGEDCAYVWKLENDKRVEITSWTGSKPSLPNIMDGIVVYIYVNNGMRWAEIKNLSGETVYVGALFPQEISGVDGDPGQSDEYGLSVVGGDTQKIIVNLLSFTNDGLINYTLMLDLNDDLKATVLWSSQE